MRVLLRKKDWTGIERHFFQVCYQFDASVATIAGAVDLTTYERELSSMLPVARRVAANRGAMAVYWEFDPVNGWSSAFLCCHAYRPEHVPGGDDWAADYDDGDVVAGPSLPAFDALYPWARDETLGAAATNLLLIARTLASFGRAASGWHTPPPLCAGYHDQAIVCRIAE